MRVEAISNDFTKIDDFSVWSCHNDDIDPRQLAISLNGDFYNLSLALSTTEAEKLVLELTKAIKENMENTNAS